MELLRLVFLQRSLSICAVWYHLFFPLISEGGISCHREYCYSCFPALSHHYYCWKYKIYHFLKIFSRNGQPKAWWSWEQREKPSWSGSRSDHCCVALKPNCTTLWKNMPHSGSRYVSWYTCTVEKPYLRNPWMGPWEAAIHLLLWPFATIRSNRMSGIILLGAL